MRALVVKESGGIDQVSLGAVEKPAPKAGEVLIEIRAVSVNFVDLVMISGSYQFKPQTPFVPGKLPAGVVAAVGPGVTRFKVGDRAVAQAEYGGFAEYVAMPEEQCVPLPAAISFTEAAGMAIVYDTAWFALRDRGRIRPGDNVLVLGATGGVGLAAIQLAKAFGAKVLAAVSCAGKTDIVREAGADTVIDLAVPDLRDSLREQVHAATAKQGADIVLDMLGGDIFDAAVRALAWSGRLVIIGFASGRIPSLKMNYLLVKNIEISGMQISDYRKRRPADMQACFAEIYAWRAAGKLKPLPIKTYRFEDYAEAMKEIRDRTQRGRVVLTLKA